MNQNLLEGMTVLDLTHRLPGPMASYLLANLGAHVLKIEDKNFGDAFNDGLFALMEESFKSWYHSLNDNKEIKKWDFKSLEDRQLLKSEIEKSDVVLMGLPHKLRKEMGLTAHELEKISGPNKVFVELLASKDGSLAMHDINALAEIGLLDLHCQTVLPQTPKGKRIAPPFLPVSGIAFGTHIACQILAASLKAHKVQRHQFINCYLKESTSVIYSPFWPLEVKEKGITSFLHNGKYPCYNIYQTKDHRFVALAAVEEKFWIQFCHKFQFSFSAQERFHFSDEKIFEQLEQKFSSLTSFEIKKIKGEDELCLTLF